MISRLLALALCAGLLLTGCGSLLATMHADPIQDEPGERTLANSAAVLAWPESHADWVRPGIMLYGSSPFMTGDVPGLLPAMTFEAEVIAVREIPAGDSVGYGARWTASRPSRRLRRALAGPRRTSFRNSRPGKSSKACVKA